MPRTLGPVALKLGDEVLVKVRANTPITDLLEQLDKAYKGARFQDVEGFDVTAHYSEDLPEGEYAIRQPTAEGSGADRQDAEKADAEFFQRLEQILPSASEVGRAPEDFVHLRDQANILNHRPINNHAAPLPLTHEAFGEFMDLFNTGVPTHSDCKFAIDLCKVASEVWTDETTQLQTRLHDLLREYFPGFQIQGSKSSESEPDERVIYNDMDIGAWQLKTDAGGNTYGQIQRYYVTVVQRLQQAQSPVLALSCVPMLYMELSGATLRVCGAACVGHSFLCEPLTPALHLYCVNNRAHMDTVVRCVCAIRCTLLKLAEFHTHLAVQALPAPFHRNPRAFFPYYFGKAYPEAAVEQLLSPTRLIFLVTPKDSQQRLVKFVACSKNGAEAVACQEPSWTMVCRGDGVSVTWRRMVSLVHTGSCETTNTSNASWQSARALDSICLAACLCVGS
ncbi:hypothetical protein ABBQ38_009265 [Trebouxia sp. C0009 RCD-2024]